nr:hypothetical protein [Tanacetum cinerariifolium]GEV30301.1 hypothetical protein [Tanacetum cinerariifolium]
MSRNDLITTWARFEESAKTHFGPSKYEDPHGALSKLLQLGTVEDYQREFEKLMNRVTNIPDSLLIFFYLSGLKLNLQHELLASRPTTLGDAFFLARIIEARFEANVKKEENVKEKADTTLLLLIKEVLHVVKGPLDASEDTLLLQRPVDEVNSAINGVFDMEVVGGDEALGVDKDDASGNATMDGGDDAVESGDISILNSLTGHESSRSPTLWERSVQRMFKCSLIKGLIKKPLKGDLVAKGFVDITLTCVRSQVQFLLGANNLEVSTPTS